MALIKNKIKGKIRLQTYLTQHAEHAEHDMTFFSINDDDHHPMDEKSFENKTNLFSFHINSSLLVLVLHSY